jgi:hypothetical protein
VPRRLISVTIDNRLRVRKRDLPPGHEAQIKQRLTVVNGEKAAARKRQQWGWQDLPESFALYEDEGPVLVMPRGFAAELRAGLTMAGHEVRWDDRTAAASLRFDRVRARGADAAPGPGGSLLGAAPAPPGRPAGADGPARPCSSWRPGAAPACAA